MQIKRHKNIHGQKFGKLTIIERSTVKTNHKSRCARWLCKCDCGNMKIVGANELFAGKTKSCGCFNKELVAQKSFKHGHAIDKNHHTPEYRTWKAMIQRCTNPKRRGWENYGGRGIKVCDRWKNDFILFFQDMGEKPSPKHVIDRIDVNGNYTPNNCHWATPKESANNKRSPKNSRFIEAFGKKQTLSEWSRELKIPKTTLWERINKNKWPSIT